MIPKRAIFFWEGGEMSWLREQSLVTFKALNPAWEIVILGGAELPIKGNSRLDVVLRSDWARYNALADRGGVYFDTDIVFCKPIPDSWLENDLILPLGEDKIIGHVAVLGANQGDPWFSSLNETCAATYRPDGIYDYQEFGVPLVNANAGAIRGRKIKWLHPETVLPVAWNRTAALWSEGLPLTPLAYGVHWYGGDWLSIAMEQKATPAWAEKSTCIVAKAIRMSWSAEREAHRDHLGV